LKSSSLSINTLPSYHIQHKLIKKSNEENNIKNGVIHVDEHLKKIKLEQWKCEN
jgi:hypothetical protein